MKRSYDAMDNTGDDVEQGYQMSKRVKLQDDAARNLMINYLPKSILEPELNDLFAPYGDIESVKVVVDPKTRESKCYGFVKYHEASSATRAMRELHGHEIEGKRLKVGYSKKGTVPTTVFFSGFEGAFKDDDVRALAEQYGTVSEVRVLPLEKHPHGVGFVTFAEPEQAADCIERLNNLEFDITDGQKARLIVKYANPRQDRSQPAVMPYTTFPMAAQPMQFAAPAVQPIITPEAVTQLQQVLALFGGANGLAALASAAGGGVMQPQLVPQPMAVPQQLHTAAPMGGLSTGEHVLFVRGFIECNEADVRPLFEPFGATQFDLPKNPDGRPRNFCFVHFPTREMGQLAIDRMDGFNLGNRTLQVRFKN